MMRTSYDPEADAFAVRFAPKGTPIAHTEEAAPGVMLDFDADGKVIAVEVLSVSWRMKDARTAAPGDQPASFETAFLPAEHRR